MRATATIDSLRRKWWASFVILPVVALQGRYLRRNIPLLPEARGETRGRIATGTRELSLVVLGESTAAGVGATSHEAGFAGYLAQYLAVSWHAAVSWQAIGRTGATMADIHRELASQIEGSIDLVVVLSGVNDAMRLTSEDKWSSGIRQLVDDLSEHQVSHICFSSVPAMQDFPALRDPLRAIMGLRASILDLTLQSTLRELPTTSYCPTIFSHDPTSVARDGFHPSSRGYQNWAQQVANHLSGLRATGLCKLLPE